MRRLETHGIFIDQIGSKRKINVVSATPLDLRTVPLMNPMHPWMVVQSDWNPGHGGNHKTVEARATLRAAHQGQGVQSHCQEVL